MSFKKCSECSDTNKDSCEAEQYCRKKILSERKESQARVNKLSVKERFLLIFKAFDVTECNEMRCKSGVETRLVYPKFQHAEKAFFCKECFDKENVFRREECGLPELNWDNYK